MFNDREELAGLPETSVTVKLRATPDAAPVKISGLVVLALANPEVASLLLKGSVTSVLFQPAAVAAGEAQPNPTSGGVTSRLIVTERVVVPPCEVAVQMNVVPAVS